MNVIVPPAAGVVVPPDRTEPIELVGIAVPAVPLAGPAAVVVVVLLTVVEVIPVPQVLVEALLLVSPL